MSKSTLTYTGSCYVAIVGGELETGEARDSIESIQLRTGDARRFIRATKGYEARQSHFVAWLTETAHPFMLLLDSDQKFPANILERLRSHQLPFVSGFYMRRRYNPIAPVWFHDTGGRLPFRPWCTNVEPDKLYPLGASGWGCMLIHREVAEKVGALLKGEPFVIEDDMDVYPYDLGKILSAIHELQQLQDKKLSAPYLNSRIKEIYTVLEQEIRPLRGLKDPIGSDIRFAFYARKAGYQLWGDSGAACGHMLNYPLQVTDYTTMPLEAFAALEKAAISGQQDERKKVNACLAMLKEI